MRNILSGEFIRFALSGGVGFVVTFVLTFVLTEYVRWWYGASFVFATFVGWICIFVLSTFFTFREVSHEGMLVRFFAFMLTYAGSFVLNASIVIVLTEAFGVYYLLSIVAGTVVVIFINYVVSKHILFMRNGTHPAITKMVVLLREHIAALALALITALIVLTPNVMLWTDPGFRGIEMMMLDAENHYLARITEVSQGHFAAGNTFLPNKNIPYVTPPLGEIIIAFFGKIFGLEPARAAVVSKSLSVFIITLLVYALAFALSRSRIASLCAASVTMLGNNLIGLSLVPFLDLVHGSPSGGPFIFFSRLVNPSISGLFLFGALFLLYRAFFVREKTEWWRAVVIGIVVGASLYITPFIYTFLGLVIMLACAWFLFKRDYIRLFAVFLCGIAGLLTAVPFLINYAALTALPGYENLSRFLGLVNRREFVLGALLPLAAAVTAFFWPRTFPKSGKSFLLIVFGALFISLNQQLLTGSYLQPGHYHWYITKPLAGLLGGLLVGYSLERFTRGYMRQTLAVLFIAVLAYNSMGFLSPWYTSTREVALAAQKYGPLVDYLNTIKESQVIWTDEETADYIPIYTAHDAPNSINVGSYPMAPVFFENRLFLEYRLRGVQPKAFEDVIRHESHHVGDRLWGLWLREKFGDPSAVPEAEFARLSGEYALFYALPWSGAFDALGITYIVVRTGEMGQYAKLPGLKERARIEDFVIYGRGE